MHTLPGCALLGRATEVLLHGFWNLTSGDLDSGHCLFVYLFVF